jgi:hypothetical protein
VEFEEVVAGDPESLSRGHDVADFACGVASLDLWLKKHASQARAVGSARMFVVVDVEQQRVVGYHALTAASITYQEATPRAARRFYERHGFEASPTDPRNLQMLMSRARSTRRALGAPCGGARRCES